MGISETDLNSSHDPHHVALIVPSLITHLEHFLLSLYDFSRTRQKPYESFYLHQATCAWMFDPITRVLFQGFYKAGHFEEGAKVERPKTASTGWYGRELPHHGNARDGHGILILTSTY